jgi:hypothetical protein
MFKHQNLYKKLPELQELEELIDKLKGFAKTEILTSIQYNDLSFPLYSVTLGEGDEKSPCVLVVGGVHGLERIGSKVALSFLSTCTELLKWDQTFQNSLQNSRIIFVPILNPVGMYMGFRSNGNNVDLMRNSPVFSEEKTQFLYGGHRISPKLPFYRGSLTEGMELENVKLWELVQSKVFPSQLTIAIDIHSGFGAKDRIWFPYAKTKSPFPHLAEVYALKKIFDQCFPNHVYQLEPQSVQYTTHGDVWDYFYDEYNKQTNNGLFLPLTLEMGSWMWIKKNPLQLLNANGIFNPILPHRSKRIMRRHHVFIDFLHRAVMSPESWLNLGSEEKLINRNDALKLWFKVAA